MPGRHIYCSETSSDSCTLYNIAHQERVTLLPYCSYVQWVPGSDVVVAQSRNTLCVWYSINAPDQQTTINIKGEVEDILRSRVRASHTLISFDLYVALVVDGLHRNMMSLSMVVVQTCTWNRQTH